MIRCPKTTRLVVGVVCVLSISCSFTQTTSAGDHGVFPGPEWAVESPEDHGLSPARLEQAAKLVGQVQERYGFLVIKDGAIVHETYFSGDKDSIYPAFSVAKGFGAALIGIAESQELLSVDDRIKDWLPIHHPDIVEDATIEHVLSMTAGHSPPGTTYEYTSGPILNSLPNIVWLASGKSPYRFYKEEMAAPMNLKLEWPHLKKGWVQIGTQRVQGLPPLPATHRDLARLGLLWLNDGNWNGQQLITERFIKASVRPPFPEANSVYGYLWWLNTPGGTWRTPYGTTGQGKPFPTAPDNMFYAAGARSQLVFVVPDHSLVVVTMGNTTSRQPSPTAQIWEAIASFLPEN